VVNLYADARDVNGNSQVIDRFFIDPVTSGVRANLYYSPDPPPAGASFQAIENPLVSPLVDVSGAALPYPDDEGLFFANAPGWLDLDSQGPGAVLSSPWWTGIEIMPQFASTDPGTYVIADGGIFQLYYSAGTWVVTAAGGVLASWSFPFSVNQALQFVAGFDGAQLFAWIPSGAAQFAAASPGQSASVAAIRFGAFQQLTAQFPQVLTGNFRLVNFVLKQEFQDISQMPYVPDFVSFASGATSFVAPAAGPGPTTMNALARFSLAFVLGDTISGINPYGFVGGPGSAYASCSWTPVTRDYTLLHLGSGLSAIRSGPGLGLQVRVHRAAAADIRVL
jgi:hypothetical protein